MSMEKECGKDLRGNRIQKEPHKKKSVCTDLLPVPFPIPQIKNHTVEENKLPVTSHMKAEVLTG